MALYKWDTKLSGVWSWFAPLNNWNIWDVLKKSQYWYEWALEWANPWASAPSNPTTWTLWYDTTNNLLKVYNGSSWDIEATQSYVNSAVDWSIHIWGNAPSTPTEWMLWYDTTNNVLKVYNGASWDEVWAWNWDMLYSDFNFQNKTWATITLDLASTITPSANFTVNAPSTIKDWQTYILRVNNGSTAYTMTLGTNITNPYGTDLTLTADWFDQFVFLAVWWKLELQPSNTPIDYTAWNWIIISNDVISVDENAIRNISVSWSSLWAFFNSCLAFWTVHEISAWAWTNYTMKWIWYIRVHMMYWWRLEINWVEVFSEYFRSWTYHEKYYLWPFTVSKWDNLVLSLPGWGWRISATIYDYYDDSTPITAPWIYYSSSQQLVSMSTDWENWFSIADRDLWWSPDSRWSLYYWWDSWNENWEEEISSKPWYRCLTESDYLQMRTIFRTFYWDSYDFRPLIHMTTSASQYSDGSDNTYYWTSRIASNPGVAITRNLPSYTSNLPVDTYWSDAYVSWVSSHPTPRQHPVRPVKNVPVQPTLSWSVVYQPSN